MNAQKPTTVRAGHWTTGRIPSRPVVLDTGPLTCDVIRASRSRYGLPSPLNLAMRLGALRGYSASHVWAEVPRVLAKRATRVGLRLQVLEHVWWNEYVPLIRFVDCAGLPMTDEAIKLSRRDPSDSATLVLAGLLAPVVVIAEDKDILASGLAYEQWRDLYDGAEAILVGEAHAQLTAGAVWLAGFGLVQGSRAIVRASRNPWVLGAAGAAALLACASADWWAPRLRRGWQDRAVRWRETATAIGTTLAEGMQRMYQAELLWHSAQRGVAGQPLIHRAARTLASFHESMTRTELTAALGLANHRAVMTDLADLLYKHPAFQPCGLYRWQLGREQIDFGVSSGRPGTLGNAIVPQRVSR